MREIYTKIVEGGNIAQIGSAIVFDDLIVENEITKEEYDEVLQSLLETEPSEEEITEDDYIEALNILGIKIDN